MNKKKNIQALTGTSHGMPVLPQDGAVKHYEGTM